MPRTYYRSPYFDSPWYRSGYYGGEIGVDLPAPNIDDPGATVGYELAPGATVGYELDPGATVLYVINNPEATLA